MLNEKTEPEIEEAPSETEEEKTEAEWKLAEAPEVKEEKAEEVKKAPEAKPEEEGVEVVEEKVYTIPLRKVWYGPRTSRAPKATRILREFIERHMKTKNISLSNEINQAIWSRGIEKPPRKIRVRAVKDKEGKVVLYPV